MMRKERELSLPETPLFEQVREKRLSMAPLGQGSGEQESASESRGSKLEQRTIPHVTRHVGRAAVSLEEAHQRDAYSARHTRALLSRLQQYPSGLSSPRTN